MSNDEVLILESWYMCPEHGAIHHPHGPELRRPCPECSEKHEGRYVFDEVLGELVKES